MAAGPQIIISNLQALGALATNTPDPKEGYVGLPFTIPLAIASAAFDYIFDFTLLQQGGKFSAPRTLFVDNSNNPNSVNVYVQGSGQQFPIPAYSSGYFKLSSTTQASRIEVQSIGVATAAIFVEFYNYDIEPIVWNGFGPIVPGYKTILIGNDQVNPVGPGNPISVVLAPGGVAYVNRSSAVVGGAAAFNIAPANANGYQCRIRNIGDGAGGGDPAYYRLGGAASAAFPASQQIPINPQWYLFPYTLFGALSVFSTQTTNLECETW